MTPPGSERLESLMALLMRARDRQAWSTYDKINGLIRDELARLNKENAV